MHADWGAAEEGREAGGRVGSWGGRPRRGPSHPGAAEGPLARQPEAGEWGWRAA